MALNFSNSKKPLHEAVGNAMEEYAGVEARLAAVLGALLKVDYRKSHTIFFAVGNVRSRLELTEKLFALHLPKEMHRDFSKFWDSCSSYLSKLAVFRNAIAHWHLICPL